MEIKIKKILLIFLILTFLSINKNNIFSNPISNTQTTKEIYYKNNKWQFLKDYLVKKINARKPSRFSYIWPFIVYPYIGNAIGMILCDYFKQNSILTNEIPHQVKSNASKPSSSTDSSNTFNIL
ncbi:hypothetical protein ACFLYH_01370 [Candidatus Dependentiae bacterium]